MNNQRALTQLPLVPREILFGNPSRAMPRLSPDGSRLSYLAPSAEGVLNIWLHVEDGEDLQLTNDTSRGIRLYAWAEDGEHLIYQQDLEGDENWHVYLVSIADRQVRDLTPFEGVRAQSLMTDKHHPREILVGLNRRDRSLFDIYRIRLDSGETTLDTQNPGDVVGWLTDTDFKVRAAVAHDPADGDTILRVRESTRDDWRELIRWPFGENGGPISFDAKGRLYCHSSLGSDTSRLILVEPSSGEIVEELAHDPRCDLGHVMIHPDSRVVQAVSFEYLRDEWMVLDESLREDFARLGTIAPGCFTISSRDRADRRWIVAYERDDGPLCWYVYDRKDRRADKLFLIRPELEGLPLAPMETVVIKARDDLELVAYLTRPPAGPKSNLPLVLNVHGGPWARDSWGFDPESQWLANRGYACLKVNFRASTGFGKAFLNAGNRQWGVGTMQDDLTDAVAWAIDCGLADPGRIGIYGGSYGGYATLAGLAFTPQIYACGVDIVGPSNLRTLFESIPPYWAPMKKELILRVGEVETDAEFNERISPLFHADKICAPLIIAQGANDPRVKIAEAQQMVDAMRSRDLEVEYIVYTDEGHGFARPENRLDFYGRVEEFLAKYLGGRAEPWHAVEGASADPQP